MPKPIPRPLPSELVSPIATDSDLAANNRKYQEFIEVLRRSTVQVCVPQDRVLLDRIHKTVEYVVREGPVFESIITAREAKNLDYNFLHDYESPEHIYYRWKLYSILHGDDPNAWSVEEFRMFEGGPLWRPPPLNPFADGMPLNLVEKLTGIAKETLENNSVSNAHKLINLDKSSALIDDKTSAKCRLDQAESRTLNNILRDLEPTKTNIGAAMLFCINHSYAAVEIIDRIHDPITSSDLPIKRRLAYLFLISDILNNSSAAVTNASYYREGFREKLERIFLGLCECMRKLEDGQQIKKLNQKILNVLGAWKYYQLYEDEFVIRLSDILSESQADRQHGENVHKGDLKAANEVDYRLTDSQLDGEPIDDATLEECLERKGLSLRWYKTLELSDDEEDEEQQSPRDKSAVNTTALSPNEELKDEATASALSKERFKVSKWELVTDEPARSPTMVSGLVLPERLASTLGEPSESNDQTE